MTLVLDCTWKMTPSGGLSNSVVNNCFSAYGAQGTPTMPITVGDWNHAIRSDFRDAIHSWRLLAFSLRSRWPRNVSTLFEDDLGGYVCADGATDSSRTYTAEQYGVSRIYPTTRPKTRTQKSCGIRAMVRCWSRRSALRLVPTFYSAAYKCHTTGISIADRCITISDNEESYARTTRIILLATI